MSTPSSNHSIGPTRATWTHIALCVKDLEATIAWYECFTHLTLLASAEGPDGRSAWIGDASLVDSPFVLVVNQFFEGRDPFAPVAHMPLGPFAHIGIELPMKEMVDAIADRGKAEGCLAFGPKLMPHQVGYICFLKDPDGNAVEFSYDQGIFEKASLRRGSEGRGSG